MYVRRSVPGTDGTEGTNCGHVPKKDDPRNGKGSEDAMACQAGIRSGDPHVSMSCAFRLRAGSMTGRDPIPSLEFRGRLIVHVGIHKTGTTSIQGALDAGYQQLRDNGILYPKAGRAQKDGIVEALHHPLIKSLIDEEDRTALSRIEALQSEIHDASPSTVILSSEVLSRENLSSQVFRDIQTIFPDASRTWVIYLRRQDQLAMSRYAEGIKVGLVAWPDGVRHTLQPSYLDHRLRLERLQYAVGHDMIVPVSFDAAKTRLMASFFEAAGLEMTGTLPSARHANASLPWGTLQLLRLANALPGSGKRFARRAVYALNRRISPTRARRMLDWSKPLSPRQAADVCKRYESSNLWVEDTFWNECRFLTVSEQDVS